VLQVEEVGEAWTWRWRRRVVSTVVPERGGKGLADGAVPLRFNVEEERGAGVEAHAVEAHAEEERAPAGVWRGNERVRV
jgi:hypothetical protein